MDGSHAVDAALCNSKLVYNDRQRKLQHAAIPSALFLHAHHSMMPFRAGLFVTATIHKTTSSTHALMTVQFVEVTLRTQHAPSDGGLTAALAGVYCQPSGHFQVWLFRLSTSLSKQVGCKA
jgi:hypothetical protein